MFISIHSYFTSIDQELKVFEQHSGQRLVEGSDEYLRALKVNEDRRRKTELSKLHSMAVDRWFLIQLKKRYAGNSHTVFNVSMYAFSFVNESLEAYILFPSYFLPF